MQEIKTLIEVISDGMEDNIYNMTENGKCSRCGGCCSDILPLSKGEIRTIRNYIRKNDIKEYKQFVPLVSEVVSLICPFRNEKEKSCSIYEVRPKICELFTCDNEQLCKENRESLKNNREILSVRDTFFR